MIPQAKEEQQLSQQVDNDGWSDDEDYVRAENERLEEMETLWLKFDLAEVNRRTSQPYYPMNYDIT
jgi:hypothetical protein